MISRKSVKAIADAYHSRFTYKSGGVLHFNRNRLYDFLFVNNFEAWILNTFKSIPEHSVRMFEERILQLHTGESINAPQWSRQQRQALGQRILKDLAESLICQRQTDAEFEPVGDHNKKAVDLMQRTLELDGYIYRDGILWVPEDTIIEETGEKGVLESLMTTLGLPDIPTLKHHLELSATDYQETHWDDSISNSRKVLEGILTQVAIRFSIISGIPSLSKKELSRAAAVREHLEQSGLLAKKEKEVIASIYGLLSDTGGHPYIAGQDQARLMRHLSLTFSQFVLLRLESAIRAKK